MYCSAGAAYLSRLVRADERTRTADLVSLRVIGHALQRLAQDCKSRISKRLSLLRVAPCCTVLRSRWYQSGIKDALVPRRLWRPWGHPNNLLASRSDRAPSRGPHNRPSAGRVGDGGVVLPLVVELLH